MTKYRPVIIASLILGIFAVAGTALVSFAYEQTSDRIKENQRIALLRQLSRLVPQNLIDNDIVNDNVIVNAPGQLGRPASKVYIGRRKNQPVAAVFESSTQRGYNGQIDLLVAVMQDGSLAGVRIVSHRETPGLGDKIDENRSNWILSFTGKSLTNPDTAHWKVKRDGGEFDQFTGATITPRAVVEAVKNTLVYFNEMHVKLFAMPDTNSHTATGN